VGGPVRAVSTGDSRSVIEDADGLVNASALGMGDDRRSAFSIEAIGSQTWAFDAVYTPTNTTFLRAAGSRGLTTISGFDLFRHMILGSFEAYSGIQPNKDAMLPLIDALRPD
jgi:shikimate dehydrogenase